MLVLMLLLISTGTRVDEENYTVTLTFKAMHCKECEEDLVTRLKTVEGVKADSVKVDGAKVTLAIQEGTKFPYPKLKSACPRDLRLESVGVQIRGVVSEAGGKLTVTCKDSNHTFQLANPEKSQGDKLADLKKEMGGKNRFLITGLATDTDKLTLQEFSKAEWK